MNADAVVLFGPVMRQVLVNGQVLVDGLSQAGETAFNRRIGTTIV